MKKLARTQPEEKVDAMPTKSLFINTLTKDILLNRAILDLIDNSIDSARDMRPNEDYTGIEISITATSTSFSIKDNCLGIKKREAIEYAFRFGSAIGKHEVRHSVGKFGVGMKRALFKMGRKFTVESASADSKFSVVVDVENWMSPARERDWSFPLEDRQTLSNFPGRNTGTYIQVTSLLRDVSAQFSNDRFLNVLANEVGTVHLFSIQRGLKISLNKVPIKVTPLTLKHSKLIRPAFKEFEYNGAPNKVKVEMFAGVSDYNADAAGWYIFCNKRLVIKADQTLATGWGERGGMNPRIPKYHPQFAYYRGYLFLDCDDAARLPWNTTKTGVDLDSELYRQVREQMMEPMRQVIDWLNKLKEEKDRKATDEDVLELESAIGDAEEHDLMLLLQQLRKQAKGKPIKKLPFKAPIAREVRDQTKLITISYRKPEEEVQRVKQVLHVTKNREVGEKTFEFYLKRMC